MWTHPLRAIFGIPFFSFNKNKETWKSKDYCLNVFSAKTIVLVRIYHQQCQRTSLLMVLDFLAKHTAFSRPLLSILNNLHFTKQGPPKSHNLKTPDFCSRIFVGKWANLLKKNVIICGTFQEIQRWLSLVPQHLQPRRWNFQFGKISSQHSLPQCILVPVVCLQLQGLWPTSHTVPVPSRCNQNRPGLWSCLGSDAGRFFWLFVLTSYWLLLICKITLRFPRELKWPKWHPPMPRLRLSK